MTKLHDQLSSILSYLKSSRFRFWPTDRPCWLRYFMFLFNLSRQMPG